MKLKSIVLTVVTGAFLLFAVFPVRAQGMFTDNQTKEINAKKSESTNGLLRAPGDGAGGGGEAEGPGAPGLDSDPDPIGEGVLILSLLAGGYALVKRNGRKKHED